MVRMQPFDDPFGNSLEESSHSQVGAATSTV
jgi:hypothetical protein